MARAQPAQHPRHPGPRCRCPLARAATKITPLDSVHARKFDHAGLHGVVMLTPDTTLQHCCPLLTISWCGRRGRTYRIPRRTECIGGRQRQLCSALPCKRCTGHIGVTKPVKKPFPYCKVLQRKRPKKNPPEGGFFKLVARGGFEPPTFGL